MGDRWKTILLVTLVAAIIWVFAEGESLRSKEVTVRIVLAPADGGMQLLRTPSGWNGVVVLDVEGATAAVDRFEDLARQPIALRAGEHFVAESGPLDVRAILRGYEPFRRLGVTIASADPPAIDLAVDVLESVEVPVRVEVASAELSGVAVADPPRVRLMVPRSVRDRLPRDAFVLARVRAEQTATLLAGREERIPAVTLAPPDAVRDVPGVEVIPPQAAVVLTLKHKTAEAMLASVPVHVRVAPARLGEFDIEVETEYLRDVTVRGPRELIAKIESREIAVVAMVTLSRDELEAGITEKAAVFGDLPGVVEFDVERPIVSLKITRRQRPDPPPPG